MNGSKPGWKTTEFWVKIFAIDVPIVWGLIHTFIPPTTAVEVELGATAIYTAGRVIGKAIADIQAARLAGASGAPAAATVTTTVAAQ